MCDHIIFVSHGDGPIHVSDLGESVDKEYYDNMKDQRKGYAIRCTFCPYCGLKLNFKEYDEKMYEMLNA